MLGIMLDNNNHNQKLPHTYDMTKLIAKKLLFCHKNYIFGFHLLEVILSGSEQVKAEFIEFMTKK